MLGIEDHANMKMFQAWWPLEKGRIYWIIILSLKE
jgi:hypothetical protein